MRNRGIKRTGYAIALLCWSALCLGEPRVRPTEWASPVIGTSLENLYQVDNGVYRSEQPDETAFKVLANYGVGEVLSLREYHSDESLAADTALQLHRIKVATGSITQEQLVEALGIIKHRKAPILVHCWHGSDRTGAVIAAYRVVINGWSKAKALDELEHGGFGYHAAFYPNIVQLIESLDVTKMRQALDQH